MASEPFWMRPLPDDSRVGRPEDLLAERGIILSSQTVSEWAANFGLKFADQLRSRSRGHFSDKWHLNEMVVTIKGKKYWP